MRWRMKALESCRNEGKVSKSKTSVVWFCNFLFYNFPGSSSGAGSSTSTSKWQQEGEELGKCRTFNILDLSILIVLWAIVLKARKLNIKVAVLTFIEKLNFKVGPSGVLATNVRT